MILPPEFCMTTPDTTTNTVTALQIIAEARGQGRIALDETAGKRLLASASIPVPRGVVARDAVEAAAAAAGLIPPLVVKVVSRNLLHKSDVGGVRLGLPDVAAATSAIAAMSAVPAIAAAGIDGWLIEEMAPKGQEVVIGGYRDPQFGPVVMVGLGGIFVEVLKDVAFRICPIDVDDARGMLGELRCAALLDGVRGQRPVDKAALIDVLLKIGGRDGLLMRLASDIAELDINPIVVGERGLVAVDARVILTKPHPEDHAPSRSPCDDLPALERFRPLFEPRTVGVLGASAKGGIALANTFIRRMKAFGFSGDLYPIHPEAAEIEGLPAYRSIAATPRPIDYAFVALGAERIAPLLAAAGGHLRFAQVISSGFSEVEGGGALERDLVEKAHRGGVRVIGPNCLGTYSPRGGLTFPDNAPREVGSIGIISQSGGLTTNMIKRGQVKGVRFSGAVTAGNCADVTPADLLEFYLGDPLTRAIGCYLEDIKDGRRFFDLLRAATKPAVLLCGGRSAQGRLAAASHTGALAGDGRVWGALCAQTPCVEVATLDEFVDTLMTLQYVTLRPQRPTRRVVMFGNGGGTSVLGADFFAAHDLDVSPFAPGVRARLEALDLLPGSSVANPIDTPVATLQESGGEAARRILDIVYADAAPDAIALHLNMSSFSGRGGVDPIDNIFTFIEDALNAHRDAAHFLLAFRTDGDPILEERKRKYRETAGRLGIPMFDEIPELAKALAAVAHLERRLAASASKTRPR
jgi:acyl-CoA synthetase (NDP forming)